MATTLIDRSFAGPEGGHSTSAGRRGET
jgi:hypothetical protein